MYLVDPSEPQIESSPCKILPLGYAIRNRSFTPTARLYLARHGLVPTVCRLRQLQRYPLHQERRDWLSEALQRAFARAFALARRQPVDDCSGDENFSCPSRRLQAGCDIDHAPYCSELAVRGAELPKRGRPGVNADANAEPAHLESRFGGHALASLGAAALDLACRADGADRVVGMSQRKIEGRHHRVADRLVEEPVLLPDGRRALVVEEIEENPQPVLIDSLGDFGKAAVRSTR